MISRSTPRVGQSCCQPRGFRALPGTGRALLHAPTAKAGGAARYLAMLCEHELADRDARRIARHLAEAGLPRGKTLATFEFAAVPTIRKAHLVALGSGDAWLDQGGNILCFCPSGTGKSHAAAAIGHALVEGGRRVLFTRTTDLVQKLQAARRDLSLPALLSRLDRFDCLILDDLGYASKDQAETSVLFELIAERYERRSLIVTCNQPFSEWNRINPDAADRRGDRPPRTPCNHPRVQRRELQAPCRRCRDPDRGVIVVDIVAASTARHYRPMIEPDTFIVRANVCNAASRSGAVRSLPGSSSASRGSRRQR